ncbi:MAG: DinB family protein, partial [Candidatus Bathyarchaeota archaeon]
MSDEVELIKTIAEMAFEKIDRTTKNLSEKEIDWQPLKETNSIRWIFMHLSQQWNVGIPRILKGNPDYKPKDWPEDYVD